MGVGVETEGMGMCEARESPRGYAGHVKAPSGRPGWAYKSTHGPLAASRAAAWRLTLHSSQTGQINPCAPLTPHLVP